MKIGFNNIFTIFWFVLMLSSGGGLTYVSIDRGLFSSDVVFVAKFFVGIIILITFGVAGFLLLKFRVMIIKDSKLMAFYPFIFRLIKMDLSNIVKINWKSWSIKATIYRTVEIMDKNNQTISLSDFEFENFDSIVLKIPNADMIENKKDVDFEQAKANAYYMTFLIIMILAFMIFITWINTAKDRFNWILMTIYLVGLILLYSANKRRKKYRLIIKNGTQSSRLPRQLS